MPQGSNTENQVITLAPMLECWYRDQPFSQPALHPLPHALIMHMLYHVTNIYLFRPYYRSHLDINPSPSHRCDQAASMTVELLRVGPGQESVLLLIHRSMKPNTVSEIHLPHSASLLFPLFRLP
jgi:hypothetical protein